MNQRCRTRESAIANRKLKVRHGSYAARLQQICFTTIRIRLLWTAMLTMKRPKFNIQNPSAFTRSIFRIFLHLVNILHDGPAAPATKIKIQIRGFLQLGQTTVATALDKLLCYPVSAFLSDKWERCEGGLYGNEEYETCRAENSMWMPIQTIGEFCSSNKGRAANQSQTAVIASSDVLSIVFHLN
jgi:hypothetical protein